MKNGGGKMKKIIALVIAAAMLPAGIHAGTITFKDGTRISDAEVVSIKDGKIVIKKDKKERTFDIKNIESYYGTDLGDSGGAIPGEFAEYKVNILDIKMPDRGEDSKGKTDTCDVKYSITRTEPGKNKIKAPYFYLYVLTTPADGDGERQIYSYYYPNDAKVKGKGYDEAAILKKVNGFNRRVINYDEVNPKTSMKNIGGREINFELDGIDKRRIIAYRLDVWGNDKKAVEKTWKHMDYKVSDRWWEHLD